MEEPERPRGIGAPAPPPKDESGEEAYQRRLAMSQAMKAESGEDAYQRRLALSAGKAPPTFSAPAFERPAMSSAQLAQEDDEEMGMPGIGASARPLLPPAPPHAAPISPSPAAERPLTPPGMGYNPFAPQSAPPPPPPAAAIEAQIDAKRKAAAAIAAKLAALGANAAVAASTGTAPPSTQDHTSTGDKFVI
jgi:splicing factor 45